MSNYFFKLHLYLFCVEMLTHCGVHTENNLKELALSIFYEGSRSGTRDVRLDSKCLTF